MNPIPSEKPFRPAAAALPRPLLPRRVALLAALALAAALTASAGCAASNPGGGTPAGGGPQSTPNTAALATPVAGTGAASSTPTAQPVPVSQLHLKLVTIASGLSAPVYVTTARDGTGRLFIVEQTGRIRVIKKGRLLSKPFLDVVSRVKYGGEEGLLGLAFAPDYKTSGRFYIDYVDRSNNTVIARYRALEPTSDAPGFAAPETVLHITQPPYPNHKGGNLQFGPDGMLYIGMGDGGSAGDPGNRAQNGHVLLGKMLRIDVSPNRGYTNPPSNPGATKGWAPQVAMIGLRNPWRFSFDASSGALWIGDVGQNLWEEIDVAARGRIGQNWGWHYWEGNHTYPPGSTRSRSGFTFPIFEYEHPLGEAIIGGYVYRGTRWPAMVGTYLYADEVKGWVAALRNTAPDGAPLATPQARIILKGIGISPSSFGQGDAGELYLVDLRGRVFRVEGTGP